MQELADADALLLQRELNLAVSKEPRKIIVLTHVPPFKESCMHMGKISDDDWLPYFSCKVIGDVLIEAANENPSIDFLVLCGHTHSEVVYKALHNLTVLVGRVEYHYPKVQRIIEL